MLNIKSLISKKGNMTTHILKFAYSKIQYIPNKS